MTDEVLQRPDGRYDLAAPALMIFRIDQIDPAFLKTLTEKAERHG